MTDFNTAIAALESHFSIPLLIVTVLLLASEFLGTNEKVKASSIYGVIRALINTLKDQVWPKAPTA